MEDRDAAEPNVLVDTVYRGKPSKLLLHADRNGFFYVLDRTNGEVLLAKPFLRRIDWASSIGPDGRPVVKDPHGCPIEQPIGTPPLFLRKLACTISWHWNNASATTIAAIPISRASAFCVRSILIRGRLPGRFRSPGAARAKTWSGVLATAGGLIFYGHQMEAS